MDTLQKKEIKVYVPVRVAFDETGRMFPRAIQWEDGQVYTIRMAGKETYLFFEHSADFGNPIPGCWFVERREC